jgi:hypothetical protein
MMTSLERGGGRMLFPLEHGMGSKIASLRMFHVEQQARPPSGKLSAWNGPLAR